MSKNEFLKILKESLSMSLDINEINAQIDYYDKYISDEIKKGKSEKEVIDELGDPRLIAKTIKTVNKSSDNLSNSSTNSDGFSGNRSNDNYNESNRSGNSRNYRGYVNNTGTIGCVIAFLILFIIVYGILRMFGYVAYGMGSLAFSGPIGFIIVFSILYLLFSGGRKRG